MSAPLQKASQMRRLPIGASPFVNMSFGANIAAIFLLAALVELAAGGLGLFRPDVVLLDYDEGEYWRLSSQILAGVPLELGRRTIGYPLVLAGLRTIWDNIWFVQSAVAVAAAAAAPLLALLVHKLFQSRTAALLAGLGLALWPAQIFFAASLYSETIALPVFLLFLIKLPFEDRSEERRVGKECRCGW